MYIIEKKACAATPGSHVQRTFSIVSGLSVQEPDAQDRNSNDTPKSKKPRKSEDYEKYKNVLPSATSVNKFKHKKALRQEIIAAKALFSKKATTKVTLHFDTTTRCRIN